MTKLAAQGAYLSQLETILSAAIKVTKADHGNIRLLETPSGHLRIVVHEGFDQEWLDFFETIEPGTAACGGALALGNRVVVEDVKTHPIFLGAPALEVMRRAGIRSVQSTPIMGDQGECLGMLSTHFPHPHQVDEQEGILLDLLAHQVAATIQRMRTEETLRKSEQRHRTLIEAVAVVTCHCPPSGLVVEAQPSWLSFTGQTEEEMLGEGWLQAVHPDDRAATAQGWQDAVARAVPFQSKYRLRRRDGAWRWMRVTAAPLRDESGAIVEWFGASVDITAQKKLQENLRTSEQNLRAIFENAGVGIALLSKDMRFLATNDRVSEMLGYTQEELLHMTPRDVTHPADREIEAARMAEAFEELPPVYHGVKRDRRKDGTAIWVRVTATPIRSVDDEIVGSVAISEDITGQKDAEVRLLESEALVRLLFESSPIAMGIFNLDGNATLLNEAGRRLIPEARFDVGNRLARSRWSAEAPDGTVLQPENFPLARALRGERVVPGVTMQYTDAEGGVSRHVLQAVPIFDSAGQLKGAFSAAADLSDRRGVEELRSHAPRMEALAQLSGDLAAANAERALACLTRRESEVLRSLVKGHSNKEIARELGLSPRTVENHRANLMKKLEARHVTQLVSLWLSVHTTP